MDISQKFVNKVKSIDFFKTSLKLKMNFIQTGLGNVTPLTTLTPQIGGADQKVNEEQELENLKKKSNLLSKIKNIYINPFFENGNFFNLESNPILEDYQYIIFGAGPAGLFTYLCLLKEKVDCNKIIMLDIRGGRNRQNRVKVNMALEELLNILKDFKDILNPTDYLDFSAFLEKNITELKGDKKDIPINLVELLLLRIIYNILQYKSINITNSSVLLGKPTNKKNKINIRLEKREGIHSVFLLKNKYFFDCTGGRLGNILKIHEDQFGNEIDLKSKYITTETYFETIEDNRGIEVLPGVEEIVNKVESITGAQIKVNLKSNIDPIYINKVFKLGGDPKFSETDFNLYSKDGDIFYYYKELNSDGKNSYQQLACYVFKNGYLREGELTMEERKIISPFDYYEDFFDLDNYHYINNDSVNFFEKVVLPKIEYLYNYNKEDILSKIIIAKPSFNNSICKYYKELDNIIVPIGDSFLTAHQATGLGVYNTFNLGNQLIQKFMECVRES